MEPIKSNDLVVVYKPCKYCGDDHDMGHIFKVKNIVSMENASLTCCGEVVTDDFAMGHSSGFDYILWCLKKIPPLDDTDDIKETEDKPIETISTC